MLTLQFIPYFEIENLTPQKRIKKILDLVKTDRIIMLEGRLRKEEEAELIQKTMEEINEAFTGIELQVIESDKKEQALLTKIKTNLANILLGNRQGMTIIGPANIIKEIKRDPDKIELLTKEFKVKKRTRKSTKKK